LQLYVRQEDEMHTISGQVERFLQDPQGDWDGLVLDDGQLVHFPGKQGHLVTLIIWVGSHIGIKGFPCSGIAGQDYWEATLITNFDSKRSLTFLAPQSQVQPGMLQNSHGSKAASLVHSATPVGDGTLKRKAAPPSCVHAKASS
jgi:hypothetical protein